MTSIDGVWCDGGLAPAAAAAAERLGVPLLTELPAGEGVVLCFTAAHVELLPVGKGSSGPVWIELAQGRIAKRASEPGFRASPLARAVGATKGRSPRVVDATAGLGTDAALLAHLGCDVLAFERSPVLAELWRDAVARGAPDGLRFARRDSVTALPRVKPPPDVVYLDPMFPARTKRALVKKEMQVLQRVLGDEPADAPQLLAVARACSPRVVVKRPKSAPPIADGVRHDWAGSVTRFDVYVA